MKRNRTKGKKGLVVGITGGIACGKSEVGKILSRMGVAVRDTDEMAHELMRPGLPAYKKIVRSFGRQYLDARSRIDRRKLGERVFRNAGDRIKLERIVHPEVIRQLHRWLEGHRRRGRNAAGIVPLLFEVGWTAPWDAVICVTASRRTVLGRLRKRGLSRAEAQARIKAQMPVREKEDRADFVIRNNGDLPRLEKQTKKTWLNVLRKESPS